MDRQDSEDRVAFPGAVSVQICKRAVIAKFDNGDCSRKIKDYGSFEFTSKGMPLF